ncbi:S8 family peptidase [Streptomyces hoynatensis]|uniref:S8 family peptidase n=1 Tax=Streptomyces hoynatensis TaxID=1141874 RepID=A0A3A9ZFF5_9ACTN|nr:S8 family peptidase [Streptomyces hoynatensis]RKN47043.1 S8 family peptidase [Streptomyces hoynatensis]
MAVMRTPGRVGTGAAVAAATLLGLGLGAAVPAVAQADDGARGVIAGAGSADAIDGSYIVILKDSAFSATSQRAETLADSHDAKVTTVYRHALNGFAAEMSEADALELAADPAVQEVVQNETVHVAETQTDPPSWGEDRIDQPDLPLDDSFTYPDSAGAGVTAYVVDTGVRYTHEEFGGRAVFGFDAFGGDGSDGYGHGTHVAATLAGETYGLAKEADIVSVRVLDETGSGTIDEVVAGVDFVAGDVHGPAVANLSLGGGANDALDEAVRNAIDAGVVFAVAAGNDYGDDAAGTSPARVEEAITVGASDETDARSYFSNVGSVVDLFAPGSEITSAWNTSDTASDTISGTSMATPHVAGAAALYLADHPDATPAEVQDHLVDSAVYYRLTDIPADTVNALLHIGGEGGAPELPDGPRFTSSGTVPINDYETSESTIDVSDVGVLDGLFQVEVDITHTYIGDLTVELRAPDGTTRVLQDQSGGSTDDLNAVYTLNGSGLDADGTWTLSVTDNAGADEGRLNSWALQF